MREWHFRRSLFNISALVWTPGSENYMFSRLNGMAWLAGAILLSLSVSLPARAQRRHLDARPREGKAAFLHLLRLPWDR